MSTEKANREKTDLEWLMEWMNDADENHYLRSLLTEQDEPARAILESMGSIIGDLEKHNPNRLDGKRSVFRRLTNKDELIPFRSELVVAAQFARSGADFEFGKLGQPQPDLVSVHPPFGIEIKARALNGLIDLESEIKSALDQLEQKVFVSIYCPERPLVIRKEIRDEIVEKTLDLVRTIGKGKFPCTLVQPWSSTGDMELTIRVESAPSQDLRNQVSTETGALLSPHLEDIENEIWKVLMDDQKRNQAASMRTILLVDVTATGLSWARSPQTWSDRLSYTLPADCPFIGVGVVLQNLVSPKAKIGVAFHPDCPVDVREAIQALRDS